MYRTCARAGKVSTANSCISELRHTMGTQHCGIYNGYQTEINRIQLLANYVHSGVHVSHRIISKYVQVAPFIRDALDHVQELRNLQHSGKLKNIFLSLHSRDATVRHQVDWSLFATALVVVVTITICSSVFGNYEANLKALEEASAQFGLNTATIANGLHFTFSFKESNHWSLYSKLLMSHVLDRLRNEDRFTGIYWAKYWQSYH